MINGQFQPKDLHEYMYSDVLHLLLEYINTKMYKMSEQVKKNQLFLLYFKKLKYRLIKTLKIGESIFFSKDFKSTMIAGYSLHRPSSC